MSTFRTQKIAYHRNGVGGAGFHIVIFTDSESDTAARRMVAIQFEEEGYTAVLDLDELAKENIEFARGNSWRGYDHWGDKLKSAIKRRYRKQLETIGQ